jgi:hypothetical protein
LIMLCGGVNVRHPTRRRCRPTQNMTRAYVVSLSIGLVLALGCAVEDPLSRQQEHQVTVAKQQDQAYSPRVIAAPHTDDAQLVLSACGRPQSDQTVTLHNKLQDGQMRRLSYAGRKAVTLDFVPESTGGNQASAVWRFSHAEVEDETLMTSARVEVYLPCAAHALSGEY